MWLLLTKTIREIEKKKRLCNWCRYFLRSSLFWVPLWRLYRRLLKCGRYLISSSTSKCITQYVYSVIHEFQYFVRCQISTSSINWEASTILYTDTIDAAATVCLCCNSVKKQQNNRVAIASQKSQQQETRISQNNGWVRIFVINLVQVVGGWARTSIPISLAESKLRPWWAVSYYPPRV